MHLGAVITFTSVVLVAGDHSTRCAQPAVTFYTSLHNTQSLGKNLKGLEALHEDRREPHPVALGVHLGERAPADLVPTA